MKYTNGEFDTSRAGSGHGKPPAVPRGMKESRGKGRQTPPMGQRSSSWTRELSQTAAWISCPSAQKSQQVLW